MDFYVECYKKLQNIEVALFLFSLLHLFMAMCSNEVLFDLQPMARTLGPTLYGPHFPLHTLWPAARAPHFSQFE